MIGSAKVELPDGTWARFSGIEPTCGEDFCNYCGDCLHCYVSDPCAEGRGAFHEWVIYGDDARVEEFRKHAEKA